MHQPRAPLESEVAPVIQFLDQQLRAQHNWSIAAEYPNVFHESNRNNIRVIIENGQVVAHAVIKFLLVKNIMGLFKVAAIGSVVTAPEYRNQGFSQKIIENCLVAAESEGADFAILWTDLYDFYRKMGFHLAGAEVSLVMEDTPPPLPTQNLKFLDSQKVSPDAILRLYSQHTCGSLRTSEDIRKFLTIPNSRVFTAWDQNNELMAYAVEGKGADLKGYIHEWGGKTDHLLPLFAHVRKTLNAPTTVIAPTHAQNLIRQLQGWSVTTNFGFLGMIRPVNFKNLLFKINRYARQLGINDLVLEHTTDGLRIGTQADHTVITTPEEITQLLFGPLDTEQLNPTFQKILPVPMWVWGWDSV